MSIKQPKPLQIRLPFSVPKPTKSTPQVRVCGICRKQDSKYTCPRCNVAYCSLACFRDEAHAQCSEPFYKATVLDSISSDPKVGMTEKKNMMEMLRRFEEVEAEGGDGLEELLEEGEGEEDVLDELLEKLEGMDIDEMDSNELFKLLPPKHREAFIAALQNPDSEEARELLEAAASELHPSTPDVLPWWEDVNALLESEDVDQEEEEGVEAAPEPKMIPGDVLAAITPPSGVGKKLVYNAIAISLAYVHTFLSFRLPSLSPTYISAQQLEVADLKSYLGQIVPFLVEPKSTVRYESLGEAWGSVWEAIGRDMSPPPAPSTLIHLFTILPDILHPPIESPSYPKLLLLLSDIYALFAAPPGKPGAAVPRKLGFYVKALQGLSRAEWLSLEGEVRREAERLEGEQGEGSENEEESGVKERRARLEIL
ncbi:hypothetical protein IAT38_003507 [Cryptococcus sp. DSM 104549]